MNKKFSSYTKYSNLRHNKTKSSTCIRATHWKFGEVERNWCYHNWRKWRGMQIVSLEIFFFTNFYISKVVTKSDIIFLCVKPHMLITVATQIKSSIVASTREKDKVFVSVLAGVTLAQLAIVSFNLTTHYNNDVIWFILVIWLYEHIENGSNYA